MSEGYDDARTSSVNENKPNVGYAAAMAEIETILHELEGGDPDVDVLAAKVKRAAELIAVCRRRIRAAKIQVETVVASLDSQAYTGDSNTSGPGFVAAAPGPPPASPTTSDPGTEPPGQGAEPPSADRPA